MEKTRTSEASPPLGPEDGSAATVSALPAGRARILAVLRSAGRPLSLSELTERTDLHVNTVRGHLDALLESGAVSRTPAPAVGRGRPAWLYDADGPDPGPSGEYAGLAATLAATIERTSPAPHADAVSAGVEWGRSLAAQVTGTSGGPARVLRVLERMGFAPQPRADGVVRLTRCPLLQTARRHPDVVCGVHQGIVQGVLSTAEGEPTDVQLRAFAEPGACLLQLGRTAGDEP